MKKNAKTLSVALMLMLMQGVGGLAALAGTGPQRQPAGRETIITNATILTASHGTIKNGSILIRDGKIAAVGTDVKPRDANARVIDATGKFVTPGIIDCHSHTALEGNVNEQSLSVTSMARIQDILNPYDRDVRLEVAGGLTMANVLHGSANSIGGQNAVIKLKVGRPIDEWIFKDAPAGIKFALGENPKQATSSPQRVAAPRYPATRQGVEETIREAFIRAKEYMADWQEYEAKKATDKSAVAPRRDLTLEPLVEILQGKRLIHSHCYRADEILMLMNLAKEMGFRVGTLQHVLEGYKVAKEIAANKVGASTFSDWWAFKMEAFDAIPHNAGLMTARGVIVSINSDSDEAARHLYLEAAKAMKYGDMSEEAALRLITLNPAIQLGIDKRVGSIDVGKDADLVIFSHHPFSIYTVPELTMIDGDIYFERKAALDQQEAITREKQELIRREREQQRGPRPAPNTADRQPRGMTEDK